MKTLSLLLLFFGLSLFATDPTFVYLVRHAEKQDQSRDPSLSDTGKARVEMMRYFFAKTPLQVVFSSQYKRTQETVTTIAQDHKLEVNVIKAQDPGAQVAAIKEHSGKTMLVAGHSNTVPALIKALGGPALQITEKEYDDVFLVVLHDDQTYFQHFRMKAPAAQK